MSKNAKNPEPKGKWSGKVILGPAGLGRSEVRISEIEGSRSLSWNETTEAEYMQRVSSKAAQRAQKMIDIAHTQAEDIRREAHKEAYEAGVAQAQQELDAQMEQLSQQFSNILAQVEGGAQYLWNEQREDMALIVKMVAEKVTGLELSENRVKSLYTLLDQALERLEAQRGLNIRVNPADQKLVDELLKRLKGRHHGLERWKLTADPTIHQGGIIMESDFGMVDNTLETRRARVKEILEQLVI